MLRFFIVCAMFCMVVVVIHGQKTSRFENVDVDMILSNKRLLKNYIDCLLGTRGCTPEGAEVKRILPESIKTNCANCSPRQKENTKKVLRHFLTDDADYWEKLEKIYDPTGEYKRQHCESAKNEGMPIGKRCL